MGHYTLFSGKYVPKHLFSLAGFSFTASLVSLHKYYISRPILNT